MKILIPAHLFYPSILGGPSKTLYWLAKGLASEGIDVKVVTTTNYLLNCEILRDKWIDMDGFKVIYCRSKSKFSFRLIFHSILQLHSADVVLLSSVCYFPLFFIAFANLFMRKKIFWSPRGELFDSALQGNHLKLFYVSILKIIFKRTTTFHATSKEEKEVIEKYFGLNSNVIVIPNYLELPLICKRIEKDRPYILYVGRITQIKALQNLFEALLLSEKFMNSEYKLLVCGPREGEYYEHLLHFIDNNVRLINRIEFCGNIDGEEKYDYYANAYFSFLVSNSENFGNVVVEALSQGTPVVASTGTPWKSLIEKKSGYWIDNTKESIADCLNEIISLSIEEYELLRQNAWNHSREFDIYTNIGRWIDRFKN